MTDYGSGVLAAMGARTTTGDMATADVGLFGDSIAQRGTPELTSWLAGLGKTLATDNQAGCTTENALDRAFGYATLPPIIVMATGANDIFQPPLLAAQLLRALNAVGFHDKELMWVDAQVCRPNTQLADQRNTGWVNSLIREHMPYGRVAGWSRTFAAKPSRIQQYLDSGGVHPYVGPQTPPKYDGTAHWRAIVVQVLGGLL